MKTHALRLLPGQDLKTELIRFTRDKNIRAGFIITCAGALEEARLRMADERVIKEFKEWFEIVSLSGTLCQDDVHIHISLSDKDGKMIGGHLKEGCIIRITAEIIIGESDEFELSRKIDESTGFPELQIKQFS